MSLWLVTYAYYSESATVGIVEAATPEEAIRRVAESDGVLEDVGTVDRMATAPTAEMVHDGLLRHVDAPH